MTKTKQSTTSRKAMAVGLAAGILGGAAAGMVVGIPGVTGAADPGVVRQADPDTDAETDPDTGGEADPDTDAEADRVVEATERVREVLQPLVDDGTIDAIQADGVAEFLVENRPEREGHRGHGGPGGHHRDAFGLGGEVVQEVLGMEAEEIREALADGSTLADLADDPQALIDALVAEARAGLDAAVEDGRLTAEEAAERESDIAERVTDIVNGEFDPGGRGHGAPGGPGADSSTEEEG